MASQQATSATSVLATSTKAKSLTTKVQLHMSAVLSILDSHMRRNLTTGNKSERVIGTLLGAYSAGGVVEITSAYIVPHVEKDKEVAVGKDYNKQMKTLHAKSHPGDQVVGAFYIAEMCIIILFIA